MPEKQRVLICGDRHWTDEFLINMVLNTMPPGTVIIHGAAPGADKIAGRIAEAMGLTVEPYPAEWDKYGNAAGPLRNQRMLDEGKPTEVHAFHSDLRRSKGTKDMLRRAKRAGLPIAIYGSHHFQGPLLEPVDQS